MISVLPLKKIHFPVALFLPIFTILFWSVVHLIKWQKQRMIFASRDPGIKYGRDVWINRIDLAENL